MKYKKYTILHNCLINAIKFQEKLNSFNCKLLKVNKSFNKKIKKLWDGKLEHKHYKIE